jgi:hypothetical protein
VPDVLAGWNAAHSLSTSAILEPVLWETHARPELGDRPQAIINKQLTDRCDILIGTFWTRLGTKTGVAVSGTAEEIEEFRRNGRPVLLYFSTRPIVPESLDAEQFAALKQYRSILGANGLFFEYDSIDQLRHLLTSHIASMMAQLLGASRAEAGSTDAQELDRQQLRSQFEAFLRRLDAEWISERDSDPINIDIGKEILAAALEQVLSLRSAVTETQPQGIASVDEVARELRSIQRYLLTLDGLSFSEFWRQGDALVAKLHSIAAELA